MREFDADAYIAQIKVCAGFFKNQQRITLITLKKGEKERELGLSLYLLCLLSEGRVNFINKSWLFC